MPAMAAEKARRARRGGPGAAFVIPFRVGPGSTCRHEVPVVFPARRSAFVWRRRRDLPGRQPRPHPTSCSSPTISVSAIRQLRAARFTRRRISIGSRRTAARVHRRLRRLPRLLADPREHPHRQISAAHRRDRLHRRGAARAVEAQHPAAARISTPTGSHSRRRRSPRR